MQNSKLAGYVEKFNASDHETIKQAVSNRQALDWMLEHIPYFECPDKTIEETYYFRWWVFRKHIKQTPEGIIFTEFLPDVHWAGPYNSINSASGHHIAEARWLRGGGKFTDDYIRFWFRGSGNVFSYSCWMIMAVYEYCLVKNDFVIAVELLDDFVRYYERIEQTNLTRYRLFWSHDDRDAMEMSISGNGLRPTLNSYMFANAYAISRIALHAGLTLLSDEYRNKAELLKENINNLLWDEDAGFYKVIPQTGKDDAIKSFSFAEIPALHNVMEAIGYIPWSFNIPERRHGGAWKYLSDERYFGAEYGPMTAERGHPSCMNICDSHECLWNGPSWPFATTQTINGMIYALKLGQTNCLSKADFINQMRTYANCHFRTREDGTRINWLDENLNPFTGEWLSRRILRDWGWPESKGGYERGKDYNHSAFCDLIIRGICGVDLCAENKVTINPLLPEGLWDYFLLDKLPYKNHELTIMYDSSGDRFNKGKGLTVFVDGVPAKVSKGLEQVEVRF